MDCQESYWIENQLDKIVNSITYTFMNVAHSKDQDNLLNETISHLMKAQSTFNKYVNDTEEVYYSSFNKHGESQ